MEQAGNRGGATYPSSPVTPPGRPRRLPRIALIVGGSVFVASVVVVIIAAMIGPPRSQSGPAAAVGPSTQASATSTPPTTGAPHTVAPSATTRPTPSPTHTIQSGVCLSAPSACGFPSSTSTGATGTLSAVSGDVTLSTAGQVYQNKNVTGCITVTASRVVIRNVKVSCGPGGQYGIDVSSNFPNASATISHVTVTCLDGGATGIGEHHVSVDHVDVSHCENGFDIDNNATIVESWCHDIGGYDPDCFQGQATANVVIRHNTFASCSNCNSAIIDGSPGKPLNGFTVDDNLLSGGGYTLYCPAQTANPVGVSITNNRFGPSVYGYATDCVGHGFVWSGNAMDGTGRSVPAA